MTAQSDSNLIPAFRSIGAAARATVLVIAGLVLLEHAVDQPLISKLFSEAVTMHSNAAIAFILSASSLWFLTKPSNLNHRAAGFLCAIVVLLIGFLTLTESILGLDLGIDQLIFKEPRSDPGFPGRMAPNIAAGLFLVGIALLVRINRRHRTLFRGIMVVVTAIAFVALVGHLYGVESFYTIGNSRMPFLTAQTFLLLIVAIYFSDAEQLERTLLASPRLGGKLVRWMLPVAIILPLLLSGLRLAGQRAELYGTEFGMSVVALSNVLIFVISVLVAARSLEQADTQRIHAEAALYQSEQRYHNFFEATFEGVCLHDHGTILDANRAFEEMFGWSQVLGSSLTRVFAADESDSTVRAILAGDLGPFETVGLKKDGTTLQIGILSRPFVYQNRPVTVSAVRDITERKQAELALRQSEEKHHDILESITEGYYEVNLDGNFTFFNSALGDIFGYPPDELLGLNYRKYTGEASAKRMFEAMLRSYETGEDFHLLDFEVIRKDGTQKYVEASAHLIRDAAGQGIGYRGIVRDRTERKEVEKMKDQFVSMVSHELRTPLTSILGSLGLIIGGAAGQVSDQIRAMIDIAHKNSERLVRLINDILDIERIEMGKMDFDFKPIELMPLVEQSIEAIRAYGQQYGVSFAIQDALPGIMVNADDDRLIQVLTNLLSNAAKFSPPNGCVRVAVTRHNQLVRVAVRDEGPGIPVEFRNRIFQRFAQADSGVSRQKGGTGLGLSIAKGIVEKHGGEIGFETELNAGTTFYFDLPEHLREPAPAPPAVLQRSILVCEDDPDVARLLQLVFIQSGFNADMAFNATQAKQLLAQKDYAAMTLDLILPDEDGLSLLRELRENERTRELPIIVVSAMAQEGRLALDGDAWLVADWISKPIDPERVIAATRQAIRASVGKPRILHVEDDPDNVRIVAAILKDVADLCRAENLQTARRFLQNDSFNLLLLDLELPDGSGLDLLPLLHQTGKPAPPVVIFSVSEVSHETARKVAAALVKSRTTNQQLLETIQSLIRSQELRAPSPAHAKGMS